MQETRSVVDMSICDDGPARNASQDALEWGIYVRAVADFLIHRETKTPITMSVEGEWGSGKTSFLWQLKELIDDENSYPTVFFNAWRHDKDDSLWAAFALQCIKVVRKREHNPFVRLIRDMKLQLSRVDWASALPDLMKIGFRVIFLLVVVGISIWLIMNGARDALEKAVTTKGLLGLFQVVGGSVGLVAGAALVAQVYAKAKDVVGDPLEVNLLKYVVAPDYKSRVAFVEAFHEDFARVIEQYVDPGKLFIFVDDLDRCDVQHAAELMHAINMLTSGNVQGPVFVLGMDRKIVAASLAAEYAPLMPYLLPAEAGSTDAAASQAAAALDYGYSFMDKFIQLPFRVPRARSSHVAGLTGMSPVSPPSSPPEEGEAQPQEGEEGLNAAQSLRVQHAVEEAAALFDFNPRRIKQYVNVLRLTMYIMAKQGERERAHIDHHQLPGLGERNLEKISRFLAILVRWPRLQEVIEDDPDLLNELQRAALDRENAPSGAIGALNVFPGLRRFLRKTENQSFPKAEWNEGERIKIFSLEELNVRDLLDILPMKSPRLIVDAPQTAGDGRPPKSIAVRGTGSLIRSDQPWHHGALEMITPLSGGGLAHLRFDENVGRWQAIEQFGGEALYDSAALIQSRYNGGNLELVTRSGSQLSFYYRPSDDEAHWKAPYRFNFDVSGDPVLLQSKIGADGNFELVVPRRSRHLQHFWRNNASGGRPWLEEPRFADELGESRPVAMFETVTKTVSDLTVFAQNDDGVAIVERRDYHWLRPRATVGLPHSKKPPSIIRTPGMLSGYEAFVPLPAGGFEHYHLEPEGIDWALFGLAASELQVDAIAATGGENRIDVVLRADESLFHLQYDVAGRSWGTSSNRIEARA